MKSVLIPMLLAFSMSSISAYSGSSANESAADKLSFEFEALTANSFPPNLAKDTPFYGTSNGSMSHVTSFAEGQWVEYSVYIDTPGTYRIRVRSRVGENEGSYQLYVDGYAYGPEVEQYVKLSHFVTNELGDVTFLNPGYKIFKFQITGKEKKSSRYNLSLDYLELERVKGFTLMSPNKAYTGSSMPVLKWNPLKGTKRYQVFINGLPVAKLNGKKNSYKTVALPAGLHDWYVLAQDSDGKETKSNTFSFTVGDAPKYAHRDFADDFESGNIERFNGSGMEISDKSLSGKYSLKGSEGAFASVRGVTLEKIGEGEVKAEIQLGSSSSEAGIGFVADDGTFLYASIDAKTDMLSIKRKVKGYSILDTRVTPYEYQRFNLESRVPGSEYVMTNWSETSEGDEYLWTLDYAPFKISKSDVYTLTLSFSRRAMSVMAKVENSDGSEYAVVRDTADLRIMDRPALACLDGSATYDSFSYKKLDTITTKWDPDTVQVVLTPTPGDWDGQAALNPAVLYKDDMWHMIYRGQTEPAPGDGVWGYALSEIGYAYSEDGLNWTKYEGNPVIKMSPPHDGELDSIEDPDMLLADDGYIYVELRDHIPYDGEVVYRSKDFKVWEYVADIPRAAESKPGKGFKIGALLDTHTSPKFDPNDPEGVEIEHRGKKYRYLGTIERGRLVVTDDLNSDDWFYLDDVADYNSAPATDWAPTGRIAIGDAFFDEDGNIRAAGQASPDHKVGGYPECTNLEVILEGTKPWNVLQTSRLPYLQSWYGRARTGSLDEMTAWDGSTFPGNTVEKDGWLWLFNGANNTMNGVIRCYNNYVFRVRNLTLSNFSPASGEEVEVTAIVRNIGNIRGTSNVDLIVDGKVEDTQSVSLERNAETTISFKLKKKSGSHAVGIGTASATLFVK